MVFEVKHEDLSELISFYYESKFPLMIYGTFGIGKSQGVESKARGIAEQKQKEFVNWNKVDKEMKIEVISNPKKYFVFLDIRLSEFDTSDIKGLPELQAQEKVHEWLVWRVPFFVKLLENPDTDGIAFFDEMNLAPPLIQSSCYKIIHDRIVNDSKVGNDWMIMGAGNTDEDRAYVYEMAPPLKDRFGEVKLLPPSTESWIKNFAIPKEINPWIIGFLSFKPASLHVVDFNDNQKFTTPRGWERVDALMKKNPEDKKGFKKLSVFAPSAIGEGIASEYISFCKISELINLEEIIKNPQKIKEVDKINVKWFINTALAEQYKEKKIKFEKIIEFSRAMDENSDVEMVAYLWKMCAGLTKTFKKEFTGKLDQDDKLIVKYSKYLG